VRCSSDRQEERSKQTPYVDSLTRGMSSWPWRADRRCRCPSML